MTDSFYVAWRYLAFHAARTATLVACVTLVAGLPLALDVVIAAAERQLTSRADSTPLLVGAKGSAVDLVLGALYFTDPPADRLSMASDEAVADSGLADPIPLLVGLDTGRFPIIGTTLDYLDFRGLRVAEGRLPGLLGECVVGAEVAGALGIAAGDALLSSPDTVFDIAGTYPLRMRVAGVLAPSRSPDDRAILVDIRTAWIILGLGHGHEALETAPDESVILERGADNVVANAKLVQFNEITPDNVDTFHFHGDPATLPVSAVIALPHDHRAATLLLGRYVEDTVRGERIVRPADVVDELLRTVFRVKRLLDAVTIAVSSATLLALILVFALALRLRQAEMETIFRIGCGRSTMVRLVGAEIVLVLALGAIACAALVALVHAHADAIALAMLFGLGR